MTKGILSGLRVVDLSDGLAGSVAALFLAEAGAEVVKAEVPGRGFARGTAHHAVWNRSKQSVLVAFDPGAGRDRLEALLAGADVLVHDLVPARSRAHGLDDAALTSRHPHLIACSVTGYPTGHPEEDMPVDDLLVLAHAGVLDEQAAIRREGPVYLRFPLASWQAAYVATNGVLARLIARGRGVAPGPVRTSLLQGALITTQFFWARAGVHDPALHIPGGKLSQASLCECSDGIWLHLMSPPDAVPAMKAGMDAIPAEAAERARIERPPSPNIPNLHLNAIVFRTRTSAEWLPDLRAHDVAVMPALAWGAIYEDEQVLANDLIATVEDPDLGTTLQPRMPVDVAPAVEIRSGAPALDAHASDLFERWSEPRSAPKGEGEAVMPLAGLKVLDFGNFLAGPLAPSLLADLGADVIKVEQTTGDPMRWAKWAYMAANRNKRSLALQLKDPKSKPILEALIRQADVVHHNLRMPAARKLGLDYESLRAINPRIVYCHVSAYGARGPQRDWPGFDQLFQAASGWEYEGAGAGNPPMWHRFGMMDHLCAAGSLTAMLLALIERDRTGEGQAVSASLLAAATFTLGETVKLADGRITDFPRLDAMQLGVASGRRLYRCSDGWIALVADDAALSRLPAPLDETLAGRTVAEALAEVRAAGAFAVHARENRRDAFLDDAAHLASRLSVDLPQTEYGVYRQPGAFWDFGDLSTRLDNAAPALGEHSEAIMAELGFGSEATRDLADAGVIGLYASQARDRGAM